jgi:hypothetical protein
MCPLIYSTAEDFLQNLSLEALTTWFSDPTVKRGIQYAKQELVSQLLWHERGVLVGMVQGTERYVTAVTLQQAKNGTWDLECVCTCPVYSRCKHGVALLLTYQNRDRLGLHLKPLHMDSPLLRSLHTVKAYLNRTSSPPSPSSPASPAPSPSPPPAHTPAAGNHQQPPSAAKATMKSSERLRLLQQQPAEKLALALNLLCDTLSEAERLIFKSLKLRLRSPHDVLSKLSQQARDALLKLNKETPANRPILSQNTTVAQLCATTLHALQEAGGAEDVLRLWDDAFDLVQASAEATNLAVASAKALFNPCILVVRDALADNDLTIPERMLWLLGLEARDDADLLEDLSDSFWSQDFTSEHWRAFALMLANMPDSPDRIEARIDALHNAGASDDALNLRRAHLDSTRAHVHLIQLLGEMSRPQDALAAARRALSKPPTSITSDAEHADALTDGLISALLDNNTPSPSSISALISWCWHTFATYPSISSFKRLQAAAERLDLWTALRPWALGFLATGTLTPLNLSDPSKPALPPPPSDLPKKRGRKSNAELAEIAKAEAAKKANAAMPSKTAPHLPWPPSIPMPQIPVATPQPQIFFEIALESRDPIAITQSVHLFETQETPSAELLGRAAAALVKTHPQEAASMLRRIIDALISRGSHYQDLYPPFNALRPLLDPKAWVDYIRGLKNTYGRRPALIEVLNRALVFRPR